MGFPTGSAVKNLPAIQEKIPGSVRSPGEGNGHPLEYSCLENPMDIGTWWARVHRVTKNDLASTEIEHMVLKLLVPSSITKRRKDENFLR